MKIYNRVVIDIATGRIEEEDSFEYHGPIAHCGGGGGGGDAADYSFAGELGQAYGGHSMGTGQGSAFGIGAGTGEMGSASAPGGGTTGFSFAGADAFGGGTQGSPGLGDIGRGAARGLAIGSVFGPVGGILGGIVGGLAVGAEGNPEGIGAEGAGPGGADFGGYDIPYDFMETPGVQSPVAPKETQDELVPRELERVKRGKTRTLMTGPLGIIGKPSVARRTLLKRELG